MFVDKDQSTRRSELCCSMLSTLLVWISRCRCADKISLVNEVQCGTGTEWRDLIGQQPLPQSYQWEISYRHPPPTQQDSY